MKTANLSPFFPPVVQEKFANRIEFIRPGSGGSAPTTYGYEATFLIDICDALLAARNKGILTPVQMIYADQAEIIIRSVAKVGIIALVDEATGYQQVREKDALQKILDKYLQDYARKWSKTFPDEFWEKLLKIRGYPSYVALKRPAFVGRWVNDLVYDRLAPGIKKKLQELNPRTEKGYRKNKHHQYLTEEDGIPELKEHLTKLIGFMDAAISNEQFERLVARAFPKHNETKQIPFGDKQ
jgi:hypothetical protein